MKNSVLLNALNSVKNFVRIDPFSLITLASLCDFLDNKKLLAEHLTKSFTDDVKFCVENFPEFKPIKDYESNHDFFYMDPNDQLYKELKHQSYIQSNTNEDNLSILSVIPFGTLNIPATLFVY